MRTTINYGVDLGTTNSAVALLKGTEVQVIHNDVGSSFTLTDICEKIFYKKSKKERMFIDFSN